VIVAGLALCAGACSLIIDSDAKQCRNDGDCNARGGVFTGASCGADGVCIIKGTAGDAGGGDGGDGGCIGPNGCWACTPTSNDQIINACTPAECVVFDKSRLGKFLLADGGLPPLSPASAVDAGTDSGPSDAGSTDGGKVEAGTPDAGLIACSSLPNPVYIIGSAKPYIQELGGALSVATPKTTLIHEAITSCVVVDDVLNNGTYSGVGSYWDPTSGSSAEKFCAVAPGTSPDIGISAAFPESCPGVTNLPSNVTDVPGPVQAVVLVVPNASIQKVVSQEAAYAIYGFGAAAGLEPWTNDSVIFRRPPTSGTITIFGTAIGVPPEQMAGIPVDQNADVVGKLSSSADPTRTIGVLTTAFADSQRNVVNITAYQTRGQSCGYWPDSSPTSREKRNVRDGHYSMWSGLHVLTRNTTTPAKPAVGDVVAYVGGTREPPAGVKLFDVGASSGLIPVCAMKVQRTTEQGPMTPYVPTKGCGCRFEEAAGANPTCQKCATSTDCPQSAPSCDYGYCEKQ
jgi:hypothetical protein